MSKIRSILFVCTGNSCRSVMAEGLLKKYLSELGRTDIEIRSAGILECEGLHPTKETIEVMKDDGLDVSDHRSNKLSLELIKWADLILVMEKMHKEEVVNRAPEAASKTFLLKEFGSSTYDDHPSRLGVADPIGKPMANYRASFNVIKKEIERIAELL